MGINKKWGLGRLAPSRRQAQTSFIRVNPCASVVKLYFIF